MKKLTCEMCGSTDLIKQDGVFVCQVCGCKYSLEDAKKMMVEGTVEVAGTVKVDQSDELRNLYEIARRAKRDNNSQNAQKYYEQILMKDPGSWEANFYTVYYQSMNCKIGEIGSAAIRLSNCENSVLELISNNIEASSERLSAVLEIGEKLIDISRMLFYGYKNHYDGISLDIRHQYTGEYATNCGAARDILYLYGNNVISVFGNEYAKNVAVPCWKVAVELHKVLMQTPAIRGVQSNQIIIREYVRKIHKCDNSYKDDEFDTVIAKIDDGSSSSSYYAAVLKELSDFSCYDETAGYVQRCENYYGAALERESNQKKKAAEEQRIRDEKAKEQAEKTRRTARKVAPIVIPVFVILVIVLIVVVKIVMPSGKYNTAVDLKESGQYEEAILIFEGLGNYKDAADQVLETEYLSADEKLINGDYGKAAIIFGKLGNYQDSYEKALSAWDSVGVVVLYANENITAAIRSDGTVLSAGDGSSKISEWTDIVSIAGAAGLGGVEHVVGLRIDGTVVAAGNNSYGQCDVSEWTDIIAISCGDTHTVGLKSDGTVVATGENDEGQCDVDDWTDIIKIVCKDELTIALKSDGSVVSTGRWSFDSDIVDIDTVNSVYDRVVGLKNDGTVVHIGSSNTDGDYNTSSWTDIQEISCGYSHIVGLRSDGTVVATGENEYGECDVSNWTDIIAITCNGWQTVGLKSNGVVVTTGRLDDINLTGWTDIIDVACGDAIIGLKSDGTVVATGENKYGECDVDDWTDIRR